MFKQEFSRQGMFKQEFCRQGMFKQEFSRQGMFKQEFGSQGMFKQEFGSQGLFKQEFSGREPEFDSQGMDKHEFKVEKCVSMCLTVEEYTTLQARVGQELRRKQLQNNVCGLRQTLYLFSRRQE
ncbi:hypothetical protein V1264_010911 [Littorina saxatilis]|uniref:Uncharacterized protein n=1 Tax=Littorina saxatilis TaxID=31220 RepID=A0AAN9GJW3_9CAEN